MGCSARAKKTAPKPDTKLGVSWHRTSNLAHHYSNATCHPVACRSMPTSIVPYNVLPGLPGQVASPEI